MARRSSFVSLLNAAARDVARAQRQAERQRLADIRAMERANAAAAKEAKQLYVEQRAAETDELNEQLHERLDELAGILSHTLSKDDTVDFDALRINDSFPPFSPPEPPTVARVSPTIEEYVACVPVPSTLARLIPGWKERYERSLAEAEACFQRDFDDHVRAEAQYASELSKSKQEHDARLEAFQRKVVERDLEINQLKQAYDNCEPEAVVTYNNMVLERSEYPDGFPQAFRVAYVPESAQLVIDYELPGPAIVPEVAEYKFIKTRDEIQEKPRKPASKKAIYQDVVASIALRTIHEVFEADRVRSFDSVVFNGFVTSVDPATGKDIRPCVISVRTVKERFLAIELSRVDKQVCLRNLGAQVSPRPDEVQPVKPIIEFDMVDRRYVDQSDILTDLESRPNLMDLNPFEFENLIANLFSQVGLDAKLTRSSRDGGVDVVAYDTRPVLGGKVVIQAKRYKNTVGVAAVRDLYGTMINEGANKGILVTTSGYGPDAFEFSKDKPIELMDGGQLLYLLDEIGVKARIVFPEEASVHGAI